MKALQGAASVILIELAFWLLPPDHDPVFMKFPLQQQIFFIVVLVVMLVGGVVLFLNGCLNDSEKGRS